MKNKIFEWLKRSILCGIGIVLGLRFVYSDNILLVLLGGFTLGMAVTYLIDY